MSSISSPRYLVSTFGCARCPGNSMFSGIGGGSPGAGQDAGNAAARRRSWRSGGWGSWAPETWPPGELQGFMGHFWPTIWQNYVPNPWLKHLSKSIGTENLPLSECGNPLYTKLGSFFDPMQSPCSESRALKAPLRHMLKHSPMPWHGPSQEVVRSGTIWPSSGKKYKGLLRQLEWVRQIWATYHKVITTYSFGGPRLASN